MPVPQSDPPGPTGVYPSPKPQTYLTFVSSKLVRRRTSAIPCPHGLTPDIMAKVVRTELQDPSGFAAMVLHLFAEPTYLGAHCPYWGRDRPQPLRAPDVFGAAGLNEAKGVVVGKYAPLLHVEPSPEDVEEASALARYGRDVAKIPVRDYLLLGARAKATMSLKKLGLLLLSFMWLVSVTGVCGEFPADDGWQQAVHRPVLEGVRATESSPAFGLEEPFYPI
jgi:hypothetical protein